VGKADPSQLPGHCNRGGVRGRCPGQSRPPPHPRGSASCRM